MKPTMTVAECIDTYRKYGIPMSKERITELLQNGALPFGESFELATWTYTIWRLPFYTYLAKRGVPVVELKEYREEIISQGWEESWLYESAV